MISVIIPVYNDADGLEATLGSLVSQKGDFEIIVADNGSTDNTQDVAKHFERQYPGLVQLVIEADIKGSYAARNKAIGAAKGAILCFIDADMTASSNYLEEINKVFEEQDVDYVGCQVQMYTHENTIAAKYNLMSGFRVHADLSKNHFAPTCCLSIRRSILEKVGEFDARLESGGDYEFGNRVYAAGLKQAYLESVFLMHPARWKYRSLVNKSKRVARGICQLAHYYPEQYRPRYLRYFSLKRHLPKNPVSILRRARETNVSVQFWEVLALSLFHIPITIASSREAKKYMKYLEDHKKTNEGMDVEPLVSVNITTYNRAKFLGRCLDSVLNQHYQNLEINIVDDASSDETSEVAEKYCQQDSRVHYFRHQHNQGNAYARNTALKNCTGVLVAFMDDDDEWIDPDKITKQVEIFRSSLDPKLGIVCSGVKVIDASSKETIKAAIRPRNLASTLLKGNGIIHNSTVMTKRSIMEQVQGFDTKMPRGIDSEFFRTVVVKHGYRVHFMSDITAAYHEHGHARMTTNKANAVAKTWKANVHVIKKHFGSFLLHPEALVHRLLSRFKKIVTN